jgi:hypothetical protein
MPDPASAMPPLNHDIFILPQVDGRVARDPYRHRTRDEAFFSVSERIDTISERFFRI